MAAKRKRIPRYSKVQINGHEYYKTDIEDADGKRVILYGKIREEVYDKEMAALEQIDNATFRRKSPTVAEYCEKWLLMQSVYVRATTLIDYTSKVRRHIKDIHTMLDVISLPLYWKRDAVGRNGMVCCHGSEEKLIREMLTCKVHPQGNGWFCLGNNQ